MSKKNSETSINPFNVSRQELLDLAAQKLVDQLGDTAELWTQAESLVRQKVEEIVTKGLQSKVDTALEAEMTRVLNETVTPVTVWGEKTGEPTTIKALLSERAKVFWEVKVDDDGKESSWGGKPRYERLMKGLLNDAFKEAVKGNADAVVSAFKAALIKDSQKMVEEHIKNLIR